MAKILKKDVLTIGGIQGQFIGVQVGEFIIRPDSDTQMRPNDLRIIGPKTTLLVQGGSQLLVRLYREGLSYIEFQRCLFWNDKLILQRLASELDGWVWPDIGEVLRRRVEEMGEENALQALRNLFGGVEGTMNRIHFYNRIPFIGRHLVLSIK